MLIGETVGNDLVVLTTSQCPPHTTSPHPNVPAPASYQKSASKAAVDDIPDASNVYVIVSHAPAAREIPV